MTIYSQYSQNFLIDIFIIILIYVYMYVVDGIITLLFGTIYGQCLKLGIQYGCQRDVVTVQVLLWRYSIPYV